MLKRHNKLCTRDRTVYVQIAQIILVAEKKQEFLWYRSLVKLTMKELNSTARCLILVEVGEQFHLDNDIQLAADPVHCVKYGDPA